MIDTNELRRLTQAATPGPWVATTVVTAVGVCHKVGPFPGKTRALRAAIDEALKYERKESDDVATD